MQVSIYRRAIDLLLASMQQSRADGITVSFLYGRPGAPHWDRRLGAEVHFRRSALLRAALYVRQHGPAYLGFLAVEDIWSMLMNFVTENYWHVSDEIFLERFEGSYASRLSDATKATFAEALANSRIFQPRAELTVFPLIPIQVEVEFDSPVFFLIRAESLTGSRLPEGLTARDITPAQFPPVAVWEGRKETPAAWLGIHSPAVQASRKMKAAILGALALTPLHQYRYMFSQRQVFGGRCTIARTMTTSFGASHTPPMAHDTVITARDHAWLSIVSDKLASGDRAARRHLRALEYFYRAWPLSPAERFPILCMSLDAVFGDAHTAQAVVDSVRSALGSHIDEERLRRLMDVRASVIHGGGPDVYDSRKYVRYYSRYEFDPIRDIELVVAACLRAVVFGGSLLEHTSPDANIIAQLRVQGLMSATTTDFSILGSARASSVEDA